MRLRKRVGSLAGVASPFAAPFTTLLIPVRSAALNTAASGGKSGEKSESSLAAIMPSMSKTNGLCPKFTLICSPDFFIPTEGKSFPFISRKAVPYILSVLVSELKYRRHGADIAWQVQT